MLNECEHDSSDEGLLGPKYMDAYSIFVLYSTISILILENIIINLPESTRVLCHGNSVKFVPWPETITD